MTEAGGKSASVCLARLSGFFESTQRYGKTDEK